MLVSSTPSLLFGGILVGAHSALTFTLTNTGTATIDISSITSTGPAFTVTPGIATLHLKHSCTVTVTFTPTTTGDAEANLQINFHPPQSLMRLPVSGSGVVPKHKDNKEHKESKESKEGKENVKDTKEVTKEGKEAKETVADKLHDKSPILESKHSGLERLPQPFEAHPDPTEAPQTEDPTQHSFITPEERPHVGPRQPPKDESPE